MSDDYFKALTSHSKKALVTDTDPTISAVRHDATNTHTIVSAIQNGIVNTPTIVSDSRRSAPKSPDDTRGQNRMVSTIRTLPVAE